MSEINDRFNSFYAAEGRLVTLKTFVNSFHYIAQSTVFAAVYYKLFCHRVESTLREVGRIDKNVENLRSFKIAFTAFSPSSR